MNVLEKAIILATKAHEGQVDKGGNPYILHPLAVMLRVKSIDEKIVAILHDVIEDTPITLDMLASERFEKEILIALDCLTRRKSETYEQFIERITSNQLATLVKLADLQENMDLDRIPNPSEKDRSRLTRYKKAYQQLRSSCEN
jgi:(p)ppGpp synthase/HD superfamily hydrolase